MDDKHFIEKHVKDGRLRIHESVGVIATHEPSVQISESVKKDGKTLPESIIVTVEAIHAGMTKNKTFYPAQNLEKSAPTWTTPYNKPVIKNHDTSEEPLGRVIAANFKQSAIKPDTQTIELQLKITDKEAIEKVLDGRYLTLSIGGSTSSATCSICGKNIVETGWCGHMRGRKYDGKEAYWIIGEMEFEEISWVNVPADVNAQVISIQQSVGDLDEGRGNQSVPNLEDGLNEIDAILGVDESSGKNQQDDKQQESEKQPEDGQEQEEQNNLQADEQQESQGEKTDAEKLAELQAAYDALVQEYESLKTEKANLESQLQERDQTIASLNQELAVVKEERDTFRDKNITLAKTAHRILAERAVDLRVVLGEAKKEEREALIAEYARTPAKVLESIIKDLLEKPVLKQRESTPVHNPGSILTGDKHSIDEDGSVVEGTKEKEEETLTIADLAERLTQFLMQRGRI